MKVLEPAAFDHVATIEAIQFKWAADYVRNSRKGVWVVDQRSKNRGLIYTVRNTEGAVFAVIDGRSLPVATLKLKVEVVR